MVCVEDTTSAGDMLAKKDVTWLSRTRRQLEERCHGCPGHEGSYKKDVMAVQDTKAVVRKMSWLSVTHKGSCCKVVK